MIRPLLRGVVALRWFGTIWLAAVLIVSRDDIARPGAAWTLLAIAVAGAVLQHLALVRPRVPADLDLLVTGVVALFARTVWSVDPSQRLGSIIGTAAVLGIGVRRGTRWGVGAGVLLGVVTITSESVFRPGGLDGRFVASASAVVVFVVAGWLAGAVSERLRAAEREVSEARAAEATAIERARLGRDLHDGVLQTLAAVQRRTEDPTLADLARAQELELRALLAGDTPTATDTELTAALRRLARELEQRDGCRITVTSTEPSITGPAAIIERVVGVARECATNGHKHGAATTITLFVDLEGEGVLHLSVHDDGSGFDPAATVEGLGLRQSVRGRVAELGGRVEVRSAPGEGTEVRCWMPWDQT